MKPFDRPTEGAWQKVKGGRAEQAQYGIRHGVENARNTAWPIGFGQRGQQRCAF